MRITNNMLADNLMTIIGQHNERIAELQQQIATGRRINKPSDDPLGTSRTLNLRAMLAFNEQYQANVLDAQGFLTATESALQDILNFLIDAKAGAIEGATGTLSPADREALAREIDAFLESVIDSSSTEFQGKYVFGGTENLTEPFTASYQVTDEAFTAQFDQPVLLKDAWLSGAPVTVTDLTGTITYVEGTDYTIDREAGTITVLSSGSMADGGTYLIDYGAESVSSVTPNPNGIDGELSRQITDNSLMVINLPGSDVFDKTINVFDVLIDLRNSLLRDDAAAIGQSIDDLDTAMDQVLAGSGEVGAKLGRLDVTLTMLTEENLLLTESRSNVEDADVARLLVMLEEEYLLLQTSLAVGAELVENSLLQFLK